MAATRGSPADEREQRAALLDTLLADHPDSLILCDRVLTPVRASAAAGWLLANGGWARDSSAAAQVQAAAGAALDSGGAVTLTFEHDRERWEARAAPLRQPPIAVAVVVRSVAELERQRDVVLRAAHEMKAPIHTLEGFTKLLLREAAGPLSTEQRHFLEVAVSEAGRLRLRLERLLDIVRYAEAEPSPNGTEAPVPTCNIAAVTEEVASRFSGALAAKQLELGVSIAADLLVAMPEEELGTILENLLANAITASPRGSAIAIEATRAPDGTVECRVADSGPGIPETALRRVFEAYYRLPGRGEPGGTGLGLTISQGLAEARGGHLTAANGPAGGAAFTLVVPGVAAGVETWPVLRLAPVTSHVALAAARAALDAHLPGQWRVESWEGGVLDVVVWASNAAMLQAASEMARATPFACWPITAIARAGTPTTAAPGPPSGSVETRHPATPASRPDVPSGAAAAPEPPISPWPPNGSTAAEAPAADSSLAESEST